MKKTLFFLLMAWAGLASAQTIQLSMARKRAAALFAPSASSGAKRMSAAADPQLAYVSVLGGDTCFYVFNNPQGGYAIVGGDQAAREVLAVVDHGSFNLATLPENVRYMLQQYAQDIREAKACGAVEKTVSKAGTADVDTICPTTWGQDAPYSNLCPNLTGKTTKAATGCVATAGAQCLYAVYFNTESYPTRLRSDLKKDLSYEHDLMDAKDSVTGSATQTWSRTKTLDWDNMQQSYDGSETAAQKTAVAGLMQLMGIMSEMAYGPSSGADGSTLCRGLVNSLGMQTRFVSRNSSAYKNNNLAWEKMIYNELAAGRPVCYEGDNNGNGGHEFVIDGYQLANNLFHVNWGWDGGNNGYYALSSASDKKGGSHGTTSWLYPTPDKDSQTGGSSAHYRDNNGAVINWVYDASNLPQMQPAADAKTMTVSSNSSAPLRRLTTAGADSVQVAATYYPDDEDCTMHLNFGQTGIRNAGDSSDFVWGVMLEPVFTDSVPDEYDCYLLSVEDSVIEHFGVDEVVYGYDIPVGEYTWGDTLTDPEAYAYGRFTVTPILFYDDGDETYVDDDQIYYVAMPHYWKAPVVEFLPGQLPAALEDTKAPEESTGAVKLFRRNMLIIRRDGRLYDCTGRLVED